MERSRSDWAPRIKPSHNPVQNPSAKMKLAHKRCPHAAQFVLALGLVLALPATAQPRADGAHKEVVLSLGSEKHPEQPEPAAGMPKSTSPPISGDSVAPAARVSALSSLWLKQTQTSVASNLIKVIFNASLRAAHLRRTRAKEYQLSTNRWATGGSVVTVGSRSIGRNTCLK